MARIDGREPGQLRKISIEPGVNEYAEGSARVRFGKTEVLVTVSVEDKVPGWLAPGSGGWITAEYGMLPRATHTRNQREAASGKQSGRTVEIQRLIGRSLRQVLDLSRLGAVTLRVDCDVIVADGGTRVASITGGAVALIQACEYLKRAGKAPADLCGHLVAAVSVGMMQGTPLLDLCYEEDSNADFDMNIVMGSDGRFIEVQGTAERERPSSGELIQLLSQAEAGCTELLSIQRQALQEIARVA